MFKQILYDDNIPIKIDVVSISDYPIHMHDDIQLIYVLQGYVDLDLTFKTYRLNENDFHYIHSEDIHSFHSDDESNRIVILSFNVDYIEKLFPAIRTTIFTMPTDKSLLLFSNQQLSLKYYLCILMSEYLERSDGFIIRIQKTVKAMFMLLYREFRGFTIDSENKAFVYKRLQDIRQTERLGEIIDDIYKNYVEPSTLEEIALKQNLNPYYLSHLFSQTIGISYRNFINMVRAETSEYDLLASDLSISHIALSSGFSNLSYYNKHFIFWFGMTPSEYRRINSGRTIDKATPKIKLYELESYYGFIQKNLRQLKSDPCALAQEPENQTIQIDGLAFDKGMKFHFDLAFHDPDLMEMKSSFYKIHPVFDPDFIKKRFDAVKIVIDTKASCKSQDSQNRIYESVKNTISALSAKHYKTWRIGGSDDNDMLFTVEGTRTPLYYMMQFLSQQYDSAYMDPYFIAMKAFGSHQIMCWNLNRNYSKSITVKSDRLPKGSLVTVSKMDISGNSSPHEATQDPFAYLNCHFITDHAFPETAKRILDKKFFIEETGFITDERLNFSTQLPSSSLCFLSIFPPSCI